MASLPRLFARAALMWGWALFLQAAGEVVLPRREQPLLRDRGLLGAKQGAQGTGKRERSLRSHDLPPSAGQGDAFGAALPGLQDPERGALP